MFIMPIDNYNIPLIIKSIQYLGCYFNKQCCYGNHNNKEHYILTLTTSLDEKINVQYGIHYKPNEILFNHLSHKHDLLVLDKITNINAKIFTKLREQFLYNNKFKVIYTKPIFIHFNLVDIYYLLLNIIININDIEFMKPKTIIHINKNK